MPRDSNVVLLYGNDEFAIRQRMAEFGALFSDASSAEMNTARLEARTMSEDDLNNAVNAMPFLAAQRLVLLANPSMRYTTPEARAKFREFIEAVPPTAKLVMTEPVELKGYYRERSSQQRDEDKNWLVKSLRKAGIQLECYALPSARDMTGWIVKQASEQGGQIEPAAAARLAEMVGPNTRQAAQEIAKLLTYVNWSRPVKPEDVQAVSIVTAETNIFEMVDALAAGNGSLAQRLLHKLLEDEDAFGIWPMVIRQFRLLVLAREVLDQGGGLPELQQVFNAPEFVARKAAEQARRFSLPALEKVYRRLLEIDEAAKTGRMPLQTSMEMLVVELTN